MARDYAAEYARRKAKAAERGTTVYAKRAQQVETPAGAVIVSFDERRVLAFLRKAGDQPVQVKVDIRDGPQLTIFGNYGWSAAAMRADIREEDDPPRVKRAILRWIENDQGSYSAGPTKGSKPISRHKRDLDEDADEDEGDDDELLELGDLLKAQFITVPKREARKAA